MKFLHPIFCLLFLIFGSTIAQVDTIVVYDYKTRSFEKLPPVYINQVKSFDRTMPFTGRMGNRVTLPDTTPSWNTFPKSEFTDVSPAERFFDLNSYPARCATTFYKYRDTSNGKGCSGMLVSPNFVLSSAHCFVGFYGRSQRDSVMVLPAFNRGLPSPTLPSSRVKRIFYPSLYNKSLEGDMVLLELADPIGWQLGWIGIAFSDSEEFYADRVFHKFSYPGIVSPFDSSKVYNGDTLYYNYGKIEMDQWGNNAAPWLIVNSDSALQIPGMSGSSMFYTDNDLEYYSFGVAMFAEKYRHLRITREFFYAFKHIISNYSAPEPGPTFASEFSISPNPILDLGKVSLPEKIKSDLQLRLVDYAGLQVPVVYSVSDDQIVLERGSLNRGIYILQITNGENIYRGRLIAQ